MKSLTLITLSLVIASCAGTTPANRSTATGRVVEVDPFKSRLVDSGNAKNFRISDMVVEDVPTRIELYGADPDSLAHRVLETQPALVVTLCYDASSDWEVGEDDASYDEVELVVPADQLSTELTARIRGLSDETWWRPFENRRKLSQRRELARNHLALEVREYSKDAQVIDLSESFVHPRGHIVEPLSGRTADDLALVRQSVKEVTLVAAEPPVSDPTTESHDD